jgi:ABC-type multidrug transport system fused ATPase/permease subunit
MSTFRDLLHYLRVYRRYIGRRIYLVFVLTAAAALAEGFGITLLLPLLRASETAGGDVPTGGVEGVLYDLLAWMGIADSMVAILLFIGAMFLGKGLLLFARSGYEGYLQAQLLRELKTQMFDAYSTMDYRYYLEKNTGHFINVINGQVNRFFQSFRSFAGFFSKVITTSSYFIVAFVLTWKFAAMALAVGMGILLLFRYLNEYVRDLSRRTSQEMSHLNKFLVQTLQAFKYIVSTDQVSHLRSGVVNSVHRLTGYKLRQNIAQAFTGSIREPVSIVFIIGVMITQVAIFNDPIAPLFVSILLFHRGMQAMIGIQGSLQNVMNMIGSVEMVVDEFDAVNTHQESNGTQTIPALSKGIEFRNVCFAYDEEDGDVLHDINITVPANTTIALVGESGAGKSTLVDMMTLMLRPRTGDIRIDDVPGSEADLASWRSQIGYVSQETVVFDDTIANNISLWKGDYENDPEHRERVEQAARDAYAHHFIEDLPNGYQTVVGDRGVRLSGGQRQRLFVARELFKQPNLLLLDEATSALDTESERYIQQSIDDLQGEVTVVIIAHRLSTIKNVDYIYVLDEGRVIEQGSYDELRGHEESRFREMVEMQSL